MKNIFTRVIKFILFFETVITVMNFLKKIIIYNLIIFAQINGIVFGANQAQQILTTNLPEVLEIEKIIVKDIQHEKDSNLNNITIESINKVYQDYYVIAMTPIQVKIHTNVASPIIVNADFPGLRHTQNEYDFSKFNLSISPQSYTITEPYDHVVTGEFTPFAVVRPGTVLGNYNGVLLFTLGVL